MPTYPAAISLIFLSLSFSFLSLSPKSKLGKKRVDGADVLREFLVFELIRGDLSKERATRETISTAGAEAKLGKALESRFEVVA